MKHAVASSRRSVVCWVCLGVCEAGCKGITTFRAAGKRYGILKTVEKEETTEEAAERVAEEGREEAAACFIDPLTGQRECS